MRKLFPLGLVIGTVLSAPPAPLPPDMQTEAAIQRKVDAALLAASILGGKYPKYHVALKDFRREQTDMVLDNPDPREA